MKMPVVFVAHGSPMMAVEQDDVTRALAAMGKRLPAPKAIVVVSAHWEAPGAVRVTAHDHPPTIYDFSGFPPALYDLHYPSPGDPALAGELVSLLSAAGVAATLEPKRGLDHGAWVPLRHAYPSAEIPVVQVSLPVPRTPESLTRVGSALAPLRDRGVLLIGSGGLVHNLRRVHFEDKEAPVDGWARDFDDWVRDRILERDLRGISDHRHQAPHSAAAVPTTEHFDPVYFVLGAAGPSEKITWLHEGFQYGNLSMRSFELNS